MRAKLILSGAFGCIIGLLVGSVHPTLERIEVGNLLVQCEHRATVAEVLNEEWCGPAPLKVITCEDKDVACFCQQLPEGVGLELKQEEK